MRKAQRGLEDATILTTADRLIAELPKRSMAELQQQWFNVLRKIDSSRGQPEPLVRFRQAIIAEWERNSDWRLTILTISIGLQPPPDPAMDR